MSSVQRVMVIVVLALLALMLHTGLCEWEWDHEGFVDGQSLLIGWTTPRDIQSRNNMYPGLIRVTIYHGILNEEKVSVADAYVFGIALPALLLTCAAYLAMGWRRARRREHGQCVRCGYELNFDYTKRCSECGHQTAAA